MTGRWKARKSRTTLSLPSHRPLEISPNTVRFPHSHPTADDKIETLLTDSKKPQLDEKCQPCARSILSTMSRLHNLAAGPPGLASILQCHCSLKLPQASGLLLMTKVGAGPGLVPRLRRSHGKRGQIDTQPFRAGLTFCTDRAHG